MANILDSIESSKVKVGPAATSGSGSLVDADRAQDFGMASTLAPSDAKAIAEGKKPAKLNQFEKMSAFQRAAAGASAATDAGASRETGAQAAAEGYQEVRNDPFKNASTKNVGHGTALEDFADPAPDAHVPAMLKEIADKQAFKESVGPVDQLGAAVLEMTGTGALVRMLSDNYHGARAFKDDPMFDSLAGREVWGKGLSQEDLEWVADANSAYERQYKLARLEETRNNYKKISAHGDGVSTIIGLTGGVLDPAGWLAGMGVGKVAQLAKVGTELGAVSRGLMGAAEGAAGNVLVEASMQAAGEHVTPGDYFYAAGFGALFGGAISSMNRRVVGEESPPEASAMHGSTQAAAESHVDGSLKFHAGLLAEAQRRLPDDATPEQIAATARDVFNERSNAYWQQATRSMPDNERILPDVDHQKLYADGADELDGTLTRNIEGQFSDAIRRTAVGDVWGFTPATVPDNAKRLIFTEKMLRMVDNQPTFDQAKLDTLIGKWVAPIADSTMVAKFSMPQLILARSEHPIMKWVAANLLESPTQAGGPRTTAAVEHAIRQREYNSFNARYNEAYSAWRNQNGGSLVKDILFKQKHYENFNDLVATARENRAAGIIGDEHPHVKAAADAMDEGFARLAADQRSAKTLGSELLPDSSIGYTPRMLNTRFIEEHPMHREAIREEIRSQLHELWAGMPQGPKLAREVAATYINRARIEGAGGAVTPGHISDPHASSNLRDALAQHALSEADIERYMARVGRGGAKHTKGRLDLDLTKEITLHDGSVFRLGDAFIKDTSALFRQQSRYVNGDVTLSRRGIMGKQGIDQLREMLVLSRKGATDKKWTNELNAFDQTMSEFMGKPYGTAHRLADNFRILTGASRLGQAVIPQLAETGQIAAHLGTESAMRFVKDLPRLVDEVRKGKTNDLLHSLELPGGTIGDEHRTVMPWQSLDEVELAGKDAAGTLDRAIRGAAQAQYTLTGHRYLQAAQVRGVSEQILHKVMRYAKDGTNLPALKSMGMNDKLLDAIKKDLRNVAEFDDTGALKSFDIRQTDNPAAMQELRQLIERGANQIIQGNFIGERQAFVHDSFLRILTQFRSYSLTAMSKQWTRVRTDLGTAKALGLLMGQMSIALPLHLARVMAVSALMSDERAADYRENNLRPDMLARATLNYASLGGMLGDTLDAGMGMLGMEMSGVRSGSQNVLGNVPALGYVANTAQALKDKDVSGIIKAMPGGNSMFLLPAAHLTHWMQKE